MQHAYLFSPAIWQASGTHTNEQGETFDVTGESVITHTGGHWRVESRLQLRADPEVGFANDYQVEPFPDDADVTDWVSDNPVLGRLEGRFVLVGAAIISLYRSADGTHEGTECLRRLGDARYEGFGVLFRGRTRVSSWSVELTRGP